MKRLIEFLKYMGLSSIKLLFFMFLKKLFNIRNKNIKVKIKTKKTGKEFLIIRPYTTDLILVKQLLMDNGEYDFIYSKEFDYLKNSKFIIDAGANIGMFSRIIGEVCKNATIISIEPENDNYNLLQKNLNDKKYICKKNGLWNKKEKLIVIPSKMGEWGFTVEETNENKYDVFGIGIIDIMKEYNIDYIDILKMDIEGSEYEVFDNSCEKWIDKVKVIIIEIHDRNKKWCSLRIMKIMKKHNYDYKYYKNTYVFFKIL